MAQLISITSEALQATIRRLLPSQQGFGEDLQASNIITPIIDLTPTAEGSEVRADLQTALAFGSQTAHSVSNTTATLINNTGFYRLTGIAQVLDGTNGTAHKVQLFLSDGLSTKKIWELDTIQGNNTKNVYSEPVDLTIFVGAGESVTLTASTTGQFVGSSRQIADVSGNLIDPAGFTPQ